MSVFLIVILLFSGFVGGHYWLFKSPSVPEFNETWWGPVEQSNDGSIRQFKVQFDDEMIADLKHRLVHHRPWTPPLEGVQGFEYGFNSDCLDSWTKYWAEEYPFKEQEDYLNKYPQFTTIIQGLNIHFIWEKPKVPEDVEVIPLLLLHGWPGSVREFYETIPELTKYDPQRNFAVEVIAPSLPGFGFSEAAVRPGLGATEMAAVLRNLMQRLGFKKYYVQGGDWGAFIASSICTLYPKEVLGHHSNLAVSFSPASTALYIIGSLFPSWVVDIALQGRMYPILSHLYWIVREMGYLYLQSAKPDSLGVAMNDSPAGQLAYILQLVASGTRRDSYHKECGGLNEVYHRNVLLDNLMMYWTSNSFTTAARIYAETVNIKTWNQGLMMMSTPVPTCTIHAKDEIVYQSPLLLKYKFTNLLNSTVLEIAGHFLALEEPKIFADDILQCFETIREWRTSPINKDEL